MELKVLRVCSCGKEFHVIPSRLKHGRGKHCSPECQYESIKRSKKKVVERICIGCGSSFVVPQSRIKDDGRGVGKYCSRTCRDTYRVGKNSSNFINGESGNWHGPNWYSQRRKARARDNYTCVDCGMTEDKAIDAYGQPLHVHHKVPFRKFYGDYKSANNLNNLETLCAPCHRIKDGAIQQQERYEIQNI